MGPASTSMRRLPGVLIAVCTALIVAGSNPAFPARAQDDPCSDPRFRAELQQAQQQFAQAIRQYYSLPPDGQRMLDSAVREAFRGSGYNVSSLPELQRYMAMCSNSAPQRAPAPPPAPRTAPTAAPRPAAQPLAPASPPQHEVSGWVGVVQSLTAAAKSLRHALALTPPRKLGQGPLSAADADGVKIGSGQIKLGWVLYGRTDLTDEEAQHLYRQSVKARTDVLSAEAKDCDAKMETVRRKSQKFEEAVGANNRQGAKDILAADLDEAREQHARNLRELGIATGSLIPGGTGEAMHGVSGTAELAEFAAVAGQKTATGTKLSSEDWSLAANGFASYVSLAGKISGSEVGLPIGVAQTGFALMNAYASQRWVRTLENGIEQRDQTIQDNRRLLQYQMDLEAARKASAQRQIEWLNAEGHYLDLVRP